MQKIIIVSNDICVIKQIINTINRIKNFKESLCIYDIKDFRHYLLSSSFKEKNAIYFIDIYDIEYNFLDLIENINTKDSLSKIIILNTNSNLKSLLESQECIYAYLEKDSNFNKNIFDILFTLSNGEFNKINISNLIIPININKKYIESIYKWPNQKISINYRNGNNNLLISIDNSSKQIKELTKGNFYINQPIFNHCKRNYYSEPLKQLLVDLYLIYHIDYKVLSRHFHINATYIKKWSRLSKYNRKINFIHFIIGKIIIKAYFKKERD